MKLVKMVEGKQLERTFRGHHGAVSGGMGGGGQGGGGGGDLHSNQRMSLPRQTIEKCNIEAPIAKKFKIRLLRIGALRRGGRMKRADEDRASSSFFWPAALLHQLCPLEIIDTDNGHSSEEAPHQKAGKWSRKKARVPSSNGCSHFLRLDSHPKPLSGENISFGVGFYIWAGSRWPNLSYSSTSNLKKSPPQIKKKSRLKSKYSSTSNQKHHWLWFMLCFICTTCTISSSLDTFSNVKSHPHFEKISFLPPVVGPAGSTWVTLEDALGLILTMGRMCLPPPQLVILPSTGLVMATFEKTQWGKSGHITRNPKPGLLCWAVTVHMWLALCWAVTGTVQCALALCCDWQPASALSGLNIDTNGDLWSVRSRETLRKTKTGNGQLSMKYSQKLPWKISDCWWQTLRREVCMWSPTTSPIDPAA